jgi:hypothetical protein
VLVRPQDPSTGGGEPLERSAGRVTVRVPDPGGGYGDTWPDRIDERLRGGRPAAVMRHLEQIHARQVRSEEYRVDLLFDVAHQQESPATHPALEYHRHVVDPGATVGWVERNVAADRPEHPHGDLVHRQAIAGGDPGALRSAAARELAQPRGIPWPWPAHPWFEHTVHVIPGEEEGESGHMVLVGVRKDDRVDPPVPGWEASIQGDQEAVRVGSAVDQQPPAARSLDQDGIALADVEDRDPSGAARSSQRHSTDDSRGDDECHGQGAFDGAVAVRRPSSTCEAVRRGCRIAGRRARTAGVRPGRLVGLP